MTDLAEIRGRLRSILRLRPFVSFLRTVHRGRVPPNQDRFIREQLEHVCAIRDDKDVPARFRLHEALNPVLDGSSVEWRNWLLNVVQSRAFDNPVIDLIGRVFVEAMVDPARLIGALPPQVRERLGAAFSPYQEIWGVKARLHHRESIETLEDNHRLQIMAAGGSRKHVMSCVTWGQLRPVLHDPRWVLKWPNAGEIHGSIEAVLNGFAEQGVTDFALTVGYVVSVARRLLGEITPTWLPPDGGEIDPEVQARLNATICDPPHWLRPDRFRSKVDSALEPWRCEYALIEEALRWMHDEGEWHLREIEFRSVSSDEIVRVGYICKGSDGPARARPVRRKCGDQPNDATVQSVIDELERDTPQFDPDGGQWVTSKQAASNEGLETETLRRYRKAGIANDDKTLGKDQYGRVWRRPGTKYSHPRYYRITLISSTTKP